MRQCYCVCFMEMLRMENKYRRHYHVKPDGSADVLCELLDCFEQPCYFQFTKLYDRNPWIFFCGNINIFFRKGSKVSFGSVACEKRKQYYNIRTISLTDEYCKKITGLLNVYGEIIITTAFNYVSDYVWYKEEGSSGLHTQHCAYLIGESDDYYHVVDNPYVLCGVDKLKWGDNNSIFNIPKSHFVEAFKKSCFVTRIKYKDIPKTEIEELKYFMAVCKEICAEYDKNETGEVMTGKKALLSLKRELYQGEEGLMEDFFVFHLIIARRIVFKRCLNIFKAYMYDNREVDSLINDSIECWKIMKELAFESHYRHKNNCIYAAKKMEEIIEIENALISGIANIQWKIS